MSDGTACQLGSINGLCSNQLCTACAAPADDQACRTAWGSSKICLGGSCVDGNCRADVDCAGQICGLNQANLCGACNADQQCQTAPGYGAATICALDGGACIASACGTPTTTGTTITPNSLCAAANPSDVCCQATCVPGNCCSDLDCGGLGFCRNRVCTVCMPATNNTLYVDPTNGSDTSATGSSVCPFRTISRAAQFVPFVFGTPIPTGTRIVLRGNSLYAPQRAEALPITLPANVNLVGEPDGGVRPLFQVSPGRIAFNLVNPSSGISDVIIDGIGAGAGGVAVSAPANSSTTTLSNVTITRMTNDGIVVNGGGLRIGPGVSSTGNGLAPANGHGHGLLVSGGSVVVNVPSGQPRTSFDNNLGNGVLVWGGVVTMTGTPDLTGYPLTQNPPAVVSGVGTVTANGNAFANLALVSSAGTNIIDGVVTWGGQGNGMNFTAGVSVTLRRSVSAKNALAGVRITAPTSPLPMSSINLGNGSVLGRNVLQTPNSNRNAAGICIDRNFGNTNQALTARGNFFANKDCSVVSTPMLQVTSSLDGCVGGIDVGLERTVSQQQQTNIRVQLNECTSL